MLCGCRVRGKMVRVVGVEIVGRDRGAAVRWRCGMADHGARVRGFICSGDGMGLRDGLRMRKEAVVVFFAEGLVVTGAFYHAKGWFPKAAVKRVVGLPGAVAIAVCGGIVARSAFGGVLVGDVLLADAAADKEPAETAADGFDKIPRVEGVHEGSRAEGAALIRGFGVREEARGGFGGYDGGTADVVWLPGKGPEVEDAKESHFDAKEEGGDADFDVGLGDAGGSFDGAGGGKEGDYDGLPEGEEDDELDGGDFEEGLVFAEVVFELDIELDQAVHCYANAASFNDHHLNMLADCRL